MSTDYWLLLMWIRRVFLSLVNIPLTYLVNKICLLSQFVIIMLIRATGTAWHIFYHIEARSVHLSFWRGATTPVSRKYLTTMLMKILDVVCCLLKMGVNMYGFRSVSIPEISYLCLTNTVSRLCVSSMLHVNMLCKECYFIDCYYYICFICLLKII